MKMDIGVEFENYGNLKITLYYTDGCAGEIQKIFGLKDAIAKCRERFSEYCICRAVLWDADTGEIAAILTPKSYMVD
jgi:hypothetical protein